MRVKLFLLNMENERNQSMGNDEKFLSHLISDSYGSPENLAQVLDLGVEMLFYIEDHTFTKQDVQNVVAALRDISMALRQT